MPLLSTPKYSNLHTLLCNFKFFGLAKSQPSCTLRDLNAATIYFQKTIKRDHYRPKWRRHHIDLNYPHQKLMCHILCPPTNNTNHLPGVLSKVHLLVIQRVEVLVMVHQVVPELVILGGLPTEQGLVHVLDPHTKLTPGFCLFN